MSKLSWGDGPTQYFFNLTPDVVMNALEAHPVLGEKRFCTGYCQQLASFENRVYEVEFETETDDGPKRMRAVAKFYRPGRWTEAQILEEHEFMQQIHDAEVPVVKPYYFEKEGDTLRRTAGIGPDGKDPGLFYCLYPKVGGRQPEDLNPDQLQQLGRLIARMHNVGAAKESKERVHLNPEVYGEASLNFLLKDKIVSAQVEKRFEKVVRELIQKAKVRFAALGGPSPLQRIHGDCHAGNILWNEKSGPFFIDFDDMVVGPAIQDLWLLAPDPLDLHELIEGYQMMRDLPKGSLQLVEVLRGLRMLHYATWIAKRYEDPAFQKAFPQFESPQYWESLTHDLEQQIERIDGGGGTAEDVADGNHGNF